MIHVLGTKISLIGLAVPPDLVSFADLSLLELALHVNILRNEPPSPSLFIIYPLPLIDLAVSIATNSLAVTPLGSNSKLAKIKLALYNLQRSLFDFSLGLVLSEIADIELAKLRPFFLFKNSALDRCENLPLPLGLPSIRQFQ